MSITHIPFYPSDWLAGTRGLSAEETGVYITIIARMYEMAGPIERDDARLSRLCGCKTKPSFVRALEYLISEGKISDDDGWLFNERVEKEIKNVTEKSSKAKQAAQSRWDRKSNKNNGGRDADAPPKHMPQRCQPKPKPNIRDTNVSLSVQKPERFQEFWDQYPHRGGAKKNRKTCEQKYARIIKSGISEQTLISAAIRYASDADVVRGYGRNPNTWLNQEGWNDEIKHGHDHQQPDRPGTHDSLFRGFGEVAQADGRGSQPDHGEGFGVERTGDDAMDRGSGGNHTGAIFHIADAR